MSLFSAGGDPAHDVTASAGFLRCRFADTWLLNLAVQYAEYEFESVHRYLGLPASRLVTAPRTRVTATLLDVEREWPKRLVGLTPFALAGLGLGYATLDDTSIVLDGQPAELDAEGGIEGIGSLGCGLRLRRARWAVECGIRVERHLADWSLENRQTGLEGEVGDYTAWGGWLAVSIPLGKKYRQ